ncbi:MAG TPA: PadR family transcriptional regulator [Blastocatellia bacterium]|nr:PadR family transcriptional regulator [Blastocatellia bacterium]
MGKSHLGEFEELVLLAILRLNNDAYGVPIRQTLEEATGRPVSIGAIYITLERLEGKGYVSSRLGEATSERGGRAKRYYEVQASGIRVLNEARVVREKLLAGIRPGQNALT